MVSQTSMLLYRSPAVARHAGDAVFRDLLVEAEGTYFGRKPGLAVARTGQDWKAAIRVRRYREAAARLIWFIAETPRGSAPEATDE